MQGNPFIRVMAAIAVFLILGIPVWWVTAAPGGSTHVPAPMAVSGSGEKATLHVAFDFEEAPATVVLSVNGVQQSFLTPDDPLGDWEVVLPKEGADIVVEATWPTETKHALGVKITTAGFPVAEKTFWSDEGGRLKDVISLGGGN